MNQNIEADGKFAREWVKLIENKPVDVSVYYIAYSGLDWPAIETSKKHALFSFEGQKLAATRDLIGRSSIVEALC